jgi:hypothetical protein
MYALIRYYRTCITASPTSSTVNEVAGYGIASVYVPPRNRGNGYASHMMRLLHWVLAPRSALPTTFPAEWGTPPPEGPHDARFSVLYSDIGRDFYAKCGPVPGKDIRHGWLVMGACSTQWDVLAQSDNAPNQATAGRKWLSRSECIDIWKQDAELTRAELPVLARQKAKTVFAFLPDQGVGQFSIQRLMTFDEHLEPVYPLEPWGVLLLGTDSLTFATWTFEPGTKIVVLTRLRATPQTLPELLAALKYKAHELGFDIIETWDIPNGLKDAAEKLGSRTIERAEHLSAAKWYGDEADDEVEWIFNEK